MVGFQQSVNRRVAPGLEGDFASANPRGSMLAGSGQLVSGNATVVDRTTGLTATGVIVGRFARARNDTGVVNNADPGVASRIGFVHRDQVGLLITQYLGTSTFVMVPGREITLFDSGDFLARFAAGAVTGQKVFAAYSDGSAIAAAAGSTLAGASITAAAGGVFTGSIAAGVLTVSAVTSGALSVGDIISGPNIAAGTTIVSLGTGTGGTGTYNVSISQTAASGAVTAASTVLIVSAVGSGAVVPGEPLSGTGVAVNSTTTAQLTGSAGSTGNYTLNNRQTFASTTVTTSSAVETKWFVDGDPAGSGQILPGELAMISTRG